jgi:hypothetical protein
MNRRASHRGLKRKGSKPEHVCFVLVLFFWGEYVLIVEIGPLGRCAYEPYSAEERRRITLRIRLAPSRKRSCSSHRSTETQRRITDESLLEVLLHLQLPLASASTPKRQKSGDADLSSVSRDSASRMPRVSSRPVLLTPRMRER